MVEDIHSKSSLTTDSDNFDDISSFNSDNSFTPQEFIGDTTEAEDRASNFTGSIKQTRSGTSDNNTIKVSNSNDVHRIVSRNIRENNVETADELERQITKMDSRKADIVLPTALEGNSQFPEEYTMETTTGLVPVKTLEKVRKNRTNESSGSSKVPVSDKLKTTNTKSSQASQDSNALTAAKLNAAVERNREKLEKYKHHKEEKNSIKKYFFKLFD